MKLRYVIYLCLTMFLVSFGIGYAGGLTAEDLEQNNIKTRLLLNRLVGTDGAAGPARVLSIGGTDSATGYVEEILVDSSGRIVTMPGTYQNSILKYSQAVTATTTPSTYPNSILKYSQSVTASVGAAPFKVYLYAQDQLYGGLPNFKYSQPVTSSCVFPSENSILKYSQAVTSSVSAAPFIVHLYASDQQDGRLPNYKYSQPVTATVAVSAAPFETYLYAQDQLDGRLPNYKYSQAVSATISARSVRGFAGGTTGCVDGALFGHAAPLVKGFVFINSLSTGAVQWGTNAGGVVASVPQSVKIYSEDTAGASAYVGSLSLGPFEGTTTVYYPDPVSFATGIYLDFTPDQTLDGQGYGCAYPIY